MDTILRRPRSLHRPLCISRAKNTGTVWNPLETFVGNVFVATSDDRCERFVEEWVRELEGCTYPASGAVPVLSGAFPMSHREKLERPIFPGACVCRPVDRKEVKAKPAADQAIQQEWDRLRARNAWDEQNPESGMMWPERPEKRRSKSILA